MRWWLLLIVTFVTCISDPWATLGVSRSASQKDIKKAYKKLAIQWHPDKNQSPEAEEKFMEIAEAYQILTDDEKRREWERNQGQGQGNWFRSKSRGAGGAFGGFSADDIFKQFFGDSNFGEDGISTRDFFDTILEKTNRTPYLFLFTSPWCTGCQTAKRAFTEVDAEFRKLGYGTGRVNANMQPKLTQFMRVKYVPTLVVVYEEEIYHYTNFDQDIQHRSYKGLREFCESKMSERNIKIIKSNDEIETFVSGLKADLRPRMILISEQSKPTSLLHTLASQFRGEVEFGFAEYANEEMNQFRVKLKITSPSVILFKSSDHQPEIIRVSDLRKGTLYERTKKLRKLPVIRISSEEQFNDICEVSYEFPDRSRKLKCVMYINFDGFKSQEVTSYMQWGAQNAAEFADDARIVIIDANKQSDFVQRLQVTESSVVIIKRYSNALLQIRRIFRHDFGPDLTPLLWKAIFDFDRSEAIYRVPKLNDETLNFTYFQLLTRSLSRQYQRLRHLEEEELLIYIAMPLSVLMLTATFFMKNDTEPRVKKPKNARNMRRTLVEIRALKAVNKSEIEKFCSVADAASKVMVVLLINEESDDEASQEVSHEMKRQYFQKIQEFQYDPKRPEFFVCSVKNCAQEVAPELDLFPGTILALRQNWWAGYQIDIEDDIYIDNILPNFEHWLARLQDGSVQRNRYD